ncbi:MAG: diacylglycerol kinase family protein [Deltaproteobacteria bacterium]
MTFKHIHVIVNPVSGPDPVPIDMISEKLEASGAACKIRETEPDLSPREQARAAVEDGADLVIAVGGDGTVLKVAEGLIESGVPLGIIPEGTANVFATELGIPANSGEALDLLLEGETVIRSVDTGTVGGESFLLRVGVGLEAAMTVLTEPELKSRFGSLAYIWTAIKLGRKMKHTHYELELDGKRKVVKGVTCVICNSGNLGLPGVQLMPEMDLSDGYLNVVVIKQATLRTVGSIIYHALSGVVSDEKVNGERRCYTLFSCPAKEVTVAPFPEQIAARDGEEIHSGFPLTIGVRHKALLVAVPAR